MDEKFITKAIEEDRYLKATRLVDRFETKIFAMLENTCEDIIAADRSLFVDNPSTMPSTTQIGSSSLATLRVDCNLRRVDSVETQNNLRLNVAVEWLEAMLRGEEDYREGSLCVVHYKIKRSPQEDYNRVVQETEASGQWEAIRFGDDVYSGAPGVFYISIRTAEEMREGLATLSQHFLEFGDEYGVKPA